VIASYTGKATLVAADGEVSHVMLHLQVRHRSPGDVGTSWWNGRITSGADVARLAGMQVTVHLPDGRAADVEVLDVAGNLSGSGAAPF
jgi:hypothetical protein